jgi:hypothetical protein
VASQWRGWGDVREDNGGMSTVTMRAGLWHLGGEAEHWAV